MAVTREELLRVIGAHHWGQYDDLDLDQILCQTRCSTGGDKGLDYAHFVSLMTSHVRHKMGAASVLLPDEHLEHPALLTSAAS